MMINKQKIAQHFTQALANYEENALAQKQINQYLLHLLLKQGKKFSNGLEIGCGTGLLSQQLLQQLEVEHWTLNDLCPLAEPLRPYLSDRVVYQQGDAEHIEFPENLDLIVSASCLQWLHQPQKFIKKCAHFLRPQGLLLASTFAPENLAEIRALTGVGLNYPSLNNWKIWLEQAGFEILNLQQQQIQLWFDSPLAVLKHLQKTGVTATSSQVGWTKTKFQGFQRGYWRNYGQTKENAEQVPLSYAPIFLLACKK